MVNNPFALHLTCCSPVLNTSTHPPGIVCGTLEGLIKESDSSVAGSWCFNTPLTVVPFFFFFTHSERHQGLVLLCVRQSTPSYNLFLLYFFFSLHLCHSLMPSFFFFSFSLLPVSQTPGIN